MRICVDIDGTICRTRRPEQEYRDVEAMPGAVEALKRLKRQGHYLILHTARHMKTCNGNVGQVVARQGETLLAWLKKHGIEYDEIWFGKPYADVYVDDNVVAFKDWASTLEELDSRRTS